MPPIPIFKGLSDKLAADISDTISPLLSQASDEADRAETAADHAEEVAARAGTYASTSDGIVATSNGQYFWAPSGTEWLQYYQNVTGTATPVANMIMPLKAWVDARFGEGSDALAVVTKDDFLVVRLVADEQSVEFHWPVRLGGSLLQEIAGVLQLGSLKVEGSSEFTGIQIVSGDGIIIADEMSLLKTISME